MSSTEQNTCVAILLATINNKNCNRKHGSVITTVRLKTDEKPTLYQRTGQRSTNCATVRRIIGVFLFESEREYTLINILNILQEMYSRTVIEDSVNSTQ